MDQNGVTAYLYSAEKVLNDKIIQQYGFKSNDIEKQQKKLLVFIHGGPHGIAKVCLDPWLLTLFLLGYRVLSVNYTGSGGHGQKFIENLHGKCGEIDAIEIVSFVNEIVGKKLCDPTKIAAYGNSYGGYMSAILASRFSENFVCAILSNPVISMPFNIHITDIPEWNSAEALGQELNWNFQQAQMRSMFDQSPICAPSKIPIMLVLGQNDRRVPYQQSIALRAQTIANNIPCETYLYPNGDHSLNDCPQTIYDTQLKNILYLEKHLA